MQNSVKLVFTACLCLASCSVLANNSVQNTEKSKEKQSGKVLVSQISEFADVADLIPEFATWPELNRYLAQQMGKDPAQTLKAMVQFEAKTATLSIESLSQFYLSMAANLAQLNQYQEAWPVLKRVTAELLSPNELLQYYLLSGRLLSEQHELFDATLSLQQAYALAQGQNQTRIANKTAIDLADKYFQLNAQSQAQRWLAKVQYQVDETTELAVLLETAIPLARLQTELALFTDAEQTLTAAIAFIDSKGLSSVRGSLQFQLAQVYLAWLQYDSARQVYEQIFVDSQQRRDSSQQMQALIGLMELDLLEGIPWQANKILVQANKLEAGLFDRNTRLAFWQTKAKVLAAKGSYRQALTVLAKYELATDHERDLDVTELDQKLLWQLQSGDASAAVDTLAQYQQAAALLAQQTTNSKVSFLQKSREFDQKSSAQKERQIKAQLEGVNQTLSQTQNRLSNAYTGLALLVLVVLVSLYFWRQYRIKERQLQRQRDPISGAFNHHFLARRFAELSAQPGPLAMVMFDLDKMAQINGQLGHQRADQVLQQVTSRLTNRLFKNAWLTRVSGDRFVVLANKFDRKQAFVLAEILRKELNSKCFKVAQQEVRILASFAAVECRAEEDLETVKGRLNAVIAEVKSTGGDSTLS